MARHRSTPVDAPAAHRLVGIPWLSVVLVALVALAALTLLRPETYLATATITAQTPRSASVAAVDLTRGALRERVEEAVELDPAWRGRIQLSVERPGDEHVVQVAARAGDPRLAALAADTAAALVVVERDDVLVLTDSASVPTHPEQTVPTWVWLTGGVALALALLLEQVERRRTLHGAAGRIVEGAR